MHNPTPPGRLSFQIWPPCHPRAGGTGISSQTRGAPPSAQGIRGSGGRRAPGRGIPHCLAAEAGAPRGDSRTPAPPPGGPELRRSPCSSPPPQPHCLPRLAPPRGTRAPAASPAPRARGGGGGDSPSPGRAGSQRRAPSEPRPAVGRWGAGRAGWGYACLLTKNEWDTPSRRPRPRSERECPHRGRVSHSLGPSLSPRRKGGVSPPPPDRELGAGREAGLAGARPAASSASSRQRGREKERLGRDWGRGRERASEGGREARESQRGRRAATRV